MADEYKELYVPAATAIPESTVRWWTRYMLRRRFSSEQEARNEVFARRQHHDQQSWSAIFGKEGESKNRWFADNIPVYQDRWGKWKIGRPMSAFVVKQQSHKDNRLTKRYLDKVRARVGKPVEEYLSNNTSDMSDGTNGEPNAPADFVGTQQTQAGLPDYKYFERKKNRHQKLRALLQRRDPGGSSINLWDRNIRKALGEARLSPEEMAIIKKQTRRPRRRRMREAEEDGLVKELGTPSAVLSAPDERYPEHFIVHDSAGRWIGSVYKDPLAGKHKTIDTLQQLWLEFPWVSWPPVSNQASGRHKTKEEAIAYLRRLQAGEKPDPFQSEFFARHDELIKQRHEREKRIEDQESDRDEMRPLLDGWTNPFRKYGPLRRHFRGPHKIARTMDTLSPKPPEFYMQAAREAVAKIPKFKFYLATRKHEFMREASSALLWGEGLFNQGKQFNEYGDIIFIDIATKEIDDELLGYKDWPDADQGGKGELALRYARLMRGEISTAFPEEPTDEVEESVVEIVNNLLEVEDDDSLVKDVSGNVSMTFEEFVKNYEALPLPRLNYARNAFHACWFAPRELDTALQLAKENGLGEDHFWTLYRAENLHREDKQRMYFLEAGTPFRRRTPLEPFGYFLTRQAMPQDFQIIISNSDVIDNQAYLW